jgi:Bifunctional DNA primase/polymerase, N-terminal
MKIKMLDARKGCLPSATAVQEANLLDQVVRFQAYQPESVSHYVNGFKQLGLACFPIDSTTRKPKIKWGPLTPENCDYSLIDGESYGVKLSLDIVVIDIDPRNQGANGFLALAKHLDWWGAELPFVVKTWRGGYHLYLKNSKQFQFPKNHCDYPGVDILTQRSFVVGPGSVIKGKSYLLGSAKICLPF